MSYFAAAIGAGSGMMVLLVIFSNAWRLGLLPKGYDFIHEFGKSLVRTDNRKITYMVRLLLGTLLHPVVFIFIWGRDGLLGIYPYNSGVLSASLLLIIESSLFSIALWAGFPKLSPRELVSRLIFLQYAGHTCLGMLMGITFELL